MKLESRLAVVDKNIRRLECVVVAGNEENSVLLTQLRKLREDIKTTAKKDYITTQNEVLKTFRTLMEQMATLSFYASEAEEDTRNIERAIGNLNKIKGTISEDLLGLAPEKEGEEGAEAKEAPKAESEQAEKADKSEKVESSAKTDVRDYVEAANGEYFENYELWFNAVKERGLHINIDGNTVEALDENEECFGKYRVDVMEGCLFKTIEDYDRAFEEVDDDEYEEDEDAVEEDEDDDEEVKSQKKKSKDEDEEDEEEDDNE